MKTDGRQWHIGILFPVSILAYHVTCHRHVILYLHAKFRSNQTIRGEVMSSYRIFKMADIESELGSLLPGSDLVTASVYEGRNFFACQISMRYLNPRLR